MVYNKILIKMMLINNFKILNNINNNIILIKIFKLNKYSLKINIIIKLNNNKMSNKIYNSNKDNRFNNNLNKLRINKIK